MDHHMEQHIELHYPRHAQMYSLWCLSLQKVSKLQILLLYQQLEKCQSTYCCIGCPSGRTDPADHLANHTRQLQWDK